MNNRLNDLFSEKQLVIFIFVIGLALRLLGLVNITLDGDFAYHWKVAGEIANGVNYPLLGPSASVNDSFHLGPFYYYLLAIPYALGRGDFHVAIIFFSLLNSLSIPVLYYACKHWFGSSVSLKITSVYSLSAYMIGVQNFPWNPHILPTLVIFAMYSLIQLQNFKFRYVLPLFLCLGLSIQAHATAVFLLPVFFLLLPLRKIPIKMLLAGMISFLIVLLPWIYADITSGFSQSAAALTIFQPGPKEDCSISNYLVNHGHGERCFAQIRNSLFVSRIFTQSLLATRNIAIVAVMLVGIIFTIAKLKIPQKKALVLWLGFPWFLFLLYSSNIYLHYFLILIPLPFIFLVFWIDQLRKYGTIGNTLSNIIFYTVIVLNVFSYILSLTELRG